MIILLYGSSTSIRCSIFWIFIFGALNGVGPRTPKSIESLRARRSCMMITDRDGTMFSTLRLADREKSLLGITYTGSSLNRLAGS